MSIKTILYRHLFVVFVFSYFFTGIYASTEFKIEQFTTLDGLVNNTVRHIVEDSNGEIWFATSSGVSIYKDGQFKNLQPIRDKSVPGLVDHRVSYIYEVDGIMWLTTRNGYSCYDIQHECFVDMKKSNLVVPVYSDTPSTQVVDDKGRTWRVTDSDGLFVTSKDGKTEHFTTQSPNCPLFTNSLKCIFIDDEGSIWIGTDNLGVSRLKVIENDGIDYLLAGENIRMLTPYGQKQIVVANRSGDVWIFDNKLQELASHNKYEYNTYCILKDSKGNTWRGTKGGGLYLNDKKVEGLPSEDIYALYEDHDGILWIGTFGGGIMFYSLNENRFISSVLNNNTGSRYIRQFLPDNRGDVWVATSDGVFVIDAHDFTKIKAHYSVECNQMGSDEMRTLFRDSKGRMFVAEAGEGFAIRLKDLFGHFTIEDGLVNNMIQCFVEDRDGYLWMSTELGISRFNPASAKFTNYFFSCNLLNNVFSEQCGVTLADGRISFGSNNGILIIDPSVYNGAEKVVEIDINDITLHGQREVIEEDADAVSDDNSYFWLFVLLAVFFLCVVVSVVWWKRRQRHYDLTIQDLNTSNNVLEAERSELFEANDELETEKMELSLKKDALEKEKAVLSAKKETLEHEKASLSAEKEKLERDVEIRRREDMSEQERAFVSKLEQIADSQLSNPDFTVDAFASAMGLGRTVFFKKMRTLTGFSPKEYLKLKRIRRAGYLIQTTSYTIAEISTKVGVNDPLYFSRIFKEEYGCSPSKWRERIKSVSPEVDEEMRNA